jgi:hypothetical protein
MTHNPEIDSNHDFEPPPYLADEGLDLWMEATHRGDRKAADAIANPDLTPFWRRVIAARYQPPRDTLEIIPGLCDTDRDRLIATFLWPIPDEPRPSRRAIYDELGIAVPEGYRFGDELEKQD